MNAAFRDPGYGARPAGMGNAFIAVSDDVNAVLFNPAGATQAGAAQLAFSHGRPFAGLDDVNLNLNFFSCLLPLSDVATVGLGWSNLVAPVYRQNDATLLAATSLNRWWPSLTPSVSVGANLHYLHHRYDLDLRTTGDSVFANGRSESAVSFDAGVLVTPDPRLLPGLTLGLAGKSLNEPDLGLTGTDPAPREVVGGVAYAFPRVTLAFDVADRADVAVWRAGAETWFRQQTLGLRAGANSTAATAGFTTLFRAGEHLALFIDYAFSLPFQVEDTAGSHRAALGVLF